MGPFTSQTTAAKSLASRVRFSNAPTQVTVIHKGTVAIQHLVDPSRKKLPAKKKKVTTKKTNPRITKRTRGEKVDEQLRKLKEEMIYKHAEYFKKHGKNPPKAWHVKELGQLKKGKKLMTEIYAGEPKIDHAIVLQEGAIIQEEKALAEHERMEKNPQKTKKPRIGQRIRRKRRRIEKITRRLGKAGKTPEQLKKMTARLARVQASLKKVQARRAKRKSTQKSSLGRAKSRAGGLRALKQKSPRMKRTLGGRSIPMATWKARRKATKVKRKAARKTRQGLHKPKTRGQQVYQGRADYTKRLAIGRKTGGFGVGRRVGRGGRRRVVMTNPPGLGRYVVFEVSHKDLKESMYEKKGPFTHDQAIDALPKLRDLYKAMGFKIHYARVH